jgi:protein ImuB
MFCCLVATSSSPVVLQEIARACSPRVEQHGDRVVVFDAGGLSRVLGPPEAIAREVGRLAADRGLSVRVAIAPTATAARLLAHADAQELKEVGSLFLRSLFTGKDSRPLHGILDTFRRLGLKTCGEIARLPRAEVAARFGALGVALHQAACGEEARPIVPVQDERRFIERLELEWPIEGLEPLSFVLSRLCEAHAIALERADRGAVAVTTRLTLVTRERHERTLHLPAPMRDPRVLRTLIVLDLESHPPTAGIDVVEVTLDVVPGRIAQGSLLAQTLPTPETLTTLVARLGALVGETRVGAPVLVDSHDARAVAMTRFAPGHLTGASQPGLRQAQVASSVPALRRFRFPLAARVETEHGAPLHVAASARGLPPGRIVSRAGPWRTSGRWWAFDRSSWDRDEWDVEIAGSHRLRLARDRMTGHWEVAGIFD